MNITPLYELKDRLRAASIAGTALLSEDFRLKKAAESFKALEGASPVFKKLNELTAALLSENCPDKPSVLLDTITLADSVICTLGASEVSGEISDISTGTSSMGIENVPYSKLSVITDALTTAGSGKMEAVQTAWNDSPELFRDFRVMPNLVKGLGAPYAELADYVQIIVSKLGADMLPLLKKGFDPKGKKEMLRRVRAIEAICLAENLDESAFFIEQLETAEKDIRTALVYALRHNKDNIDKLIELAKTEKGKPKTAAFSALALFDSEKSAAFFEEYAKKKPLEVFEIIKRASSGWSSRLAAQLIEESLVDKNGNKVTYSQLTRNKLELKNKATRFTFQSALWGKFGAEIEKIYRGFDDAEFAPSLSHTLGETIAATKDENLKKLAVELNTNSPMRGCYVFAEGVVRMMSGEDCSKWIEEQIRALADEAKTDLENAKTNINIVQNSGILLLLQKVEFSDGGFALANRYYDDIFEGWIFDKPVPLDQPITGAIADALMKYPCWQFNRILEMWYSHCNSDSDFRERLVKCFTGQLVSPSGEIGLVRFIRVLGAEKTKGLIRGFCETHKTGLQTLQKLIEFLLRDDYEFILTETREVIELMRQGKLKTLSTEEEINELAEWNEKKHNTGN